MRKKMIKFMWKMWTTKCQDTVIIVLSLKIIIFSNNNHYFDDKIHIYWLIKWLIFSVIKMIICHLKTSRNIIKKLLSLGDYFLSSIIYRTKIQGYVLWIARSKVDVNFNPLKNQNQFNNCMSFFSFSGVLKWLY